MKRDYSFNVADLIGKIIPADEKENFEYYNPKIFISEENENEPEVIVARGGSYFGSGGARTGFRLFGNAYVVDGSEEAGMDNGFVSETNSKVRLPKGSAVFFRSTDCCGGRNGVRVLRNDLYVNM